MGLSRCSSRTELSLHYTEINNIMYADKKNSLCSLQCSENNDVFRIFP